MTTTTSSIGDALRWHAEADPHAIAVTDSTGSITRAELELASSRYAELLVDRGVAVDDLVSVRLPNTIEFVVACAAIWKAGATPQPLSHRFAAAEQRAVVELADSRLVLGADAHEFPGRSTIPAGVDTQHYAGEYPPGLAARSWKAPTSSGSTGRPKIVLAAAPARFDPEGRVAAFIPRRAVQLVAGPLYHSAPFTYAMRGLMTGHRLVLLPRFDAQAWLDAVATHRVSWAMVVPTMMHRIWQLPADQRAATDLSSLEAIMHIGAPCAPWLKRAWIDWLGAERIVEVYAGSESAGLTTIRGDEWMLHPGSVGRPVGGSEMRVVDPTGQPVPTGTAGLVQMRRSGGATYSYLGATTSLQDGWDTLGDRGSMDADGYLYIVDRNDDLIVTGGVNVYPTEVEQALERHPGIRSAIVVGVDDADLGQRVHAVIDTGTAAPLDSLAVMGWLAGQLDTEKHPRTLQFVTTPLRDDAGKVRRRDHIPAATD